MIGGGGVSKMSAAAAAAHSSKCNYSKFKLSALNGSKGKPARLSCRNGTTDGNNE